MTLFLALLALAVAAHTAYRLYRLDRDLPALVRREIGPGLKLFTESASLLEQQHAALVNRHDATQRDVEALATAVQRLSPDVQLTRERTDRWRRESATLAAIEAKHATRERKVRQAAERVVRPTDPDAA